MRLPLRAPAAIACLLALTTVAALAAPSSVATPGRVSVGVGVRGAVQPGNPLGRARFYVDPDTTAAHAAAQHPTDKVLLGALTRTAQARWFGDWIATADVTRQVDAYVDSAVAARSVPVLTLYAIPHRDCGGFSGGGLPDAAAYDAWIAAVTRGLAGRRAVVILEPDALAAADCLPPDQRTARGEMLRAAVDRLTASRATLLYVDGGHSRWLSAQELASRLRYVGVGKARGFSLNVANFYPTAEELAYGERVAALLGGSHYVIDTSRNGNGPAPAGALNWCNPAGRALGTRPTTRTSAPHADAYLWVKHPGESDGDCDRGDPVSGHWFHSYALGIVRASRKAR